MTIIELKQKIDITVELGHGNIKVVKNTGRNDCVEVGAMFKPLENSDKYLVIT